MRAVKPAVGTWAALAAGVLSLGALSAPSPALAQVDLYPTVQFITNHVRPDAHEQFETWIADYRALVEKLIAENKLSPSETCAFRSWRVLTPPDAALDNLVASGQPLDYIFIFDPIVVDVSYALADYLVAGLGEAEASARLDAFQAMLVSAPTIAFGDALTPIDALDRSPFCS